MREEDRWKFCFAAQKYILGDEDSSINFRFARKERIFSDYKLLLIPQYVEEPKVIKVRQMNHQEVVDVAIKCSDWPLIYLRLGESDRTIMIVLFRRELEGY